jgi:predicted  nucleic acid-binding Zn-ribbon protein
MIEGFTNELRDYDDILGDFKGFKEVNRREKEEKERGILKIKELIVMNEEKERNLEKKDKEINELRITLNSKERTVADIMNILQEEKKNSDSKEKKIRELQDKIELLDFKQMEVKEYLARKAERMKARYEAELALVHSLKIQV